MYRLLLILGLITIPALATAQTKVKVGTVRATVIGGVVSAQARGYFKEAGIDVDINLIDASAGFVPLLANNELNVVEGGVSANLFNGAAQGLPIKLAFEFDLDTYQSQPDVAHRSQGQDQIHRRSEGAHACRQRAELDCTL